jgi:hypothetical protein
MKAEYGIEEH